MHPMLIMPPQGLCENTSPTVAQRKGRDMKRHCDLYKTKESICGKGSFSVQFFLVLKGTVAVCFTEGMENVQY